MIPLSRRVAALPSCHGSHRSALHEAWVGPDAQWPERSLLPQSDRGVAWSAAPPDEIVPGLHICGALALRRTDELQRRGVTHVLNAAEPQLHRAAGVDLVGLGFNVFTFGADADGRCDLVACYEDAAAFVDEGRKAGGTTLVHCASGISRSSSLCMAYLLLREGWSLEAAARLVHAARQDARPGPGLWRRLRWLEQEVLAGRAGPSGVGGLGHGAAGSSSAAPATLRELRLTNEGYEASAVALLQELDGGLGPRVPRTVKAE